MANICRCSTDFFVTIADRDGKKLLFERREKEEPKNILKTRV